MTVGQLRERLINIDPNTPILLNDCGVRAHIYVTVTDLPESFIVQFKPHCPVGTTVVEIYSD